MATTPSKYQPSERLIDNQERLRKLYCDDGLTVREIAEQEATVGKTRVSEALKEYGITSEDDSDVEQDSASAVGPPTTESPNTTVTWSSIDG